MAGVAGGSIATILFTDVVDSTVLMQRLGTRGQVEDLGMTGWLRRGPGRR